MVVLYGYLRLYADKDGTCSATHAEWGKIIKLRTTRQVCNLFDQLRQLRLVEWTRGRDFNTYRVLEPDIEWITAQAPNLRGRK
jgi:hypothetical protein